MTVSSHQTVRLSKGKHSSADDGACALELASMLAGESFTDRPACVSPAIGALLRSYNDAVDDERRQDLYEYAARVVGSRGGIRLELDRAARITAWTTARRSRGWARILPPRLRVRVLERELSVDTAGVHAVGTIRRHTAQSHAELLGLLDELLAMGGAELPEVALTGLAEREMLVLP